MHFSKTYSQLLTSLPNELQNSAIEYRQLKKLIKELVAELETLGLTPDVLQGLLRQECLLPDQEEERTHPLLSISLPDSSSHELSKVVYELGGETRSGEIVPRLRLWLRASSLPNYARVVGDDLDQETLDEAAMESHERGNSPASDEPSVGNESRDDVITLSLWKLQDPSLLKHTLSSSTTTTSQAAASMGTIPTESGREVIIPLVSDTAFFRLLTEALNSLSSALSQSQSDFRTQIQELTKVVSETSRPASAGGKSDLYTWRGIFQFYMEAQVFESTFERFRGDLPIEDSEARLAQFARRVGDGGFMFQLAQSRHGLEIFLELNMRLLNLKKFQRANAEAARKILKKHAKQTALPLPSSATELIPALELAKSTVSITHVLVVSLTECLMPVVPVIEDYTCLICTSIAFKPIRLHCGHLFCVRCLVKMQKRGQGNCPMCRAPTVLRAGRSNLDQALLNFMLDWFPVETKQKAKENDLESTKEQMEELGLDTRCVVM